MDVPEAEMYLGGWASTEPWQPFLWLIPFCPVCCGEHSVYAGLTAIHQPEAAWCPEGGEHFVLTLARDWLGPEGEEVQR